MTITRRNLAVGDCRCQLLVELGRDVGELGDLVQPPNPGPGPRVAPAGLAEQGQEPGHVRVVIPLGPFGGLQR